MFRKRSVYEKGDSISNCILMVISFPICGYAKGKEKIYLDSSWKYADHARITSGYAVMYKAKNEPEGHCDCSQCGTWNERRFIGSKTLCHPDGSAKVTGGTTAAGSVKAVWFQMEWHFGTERQNVMWTLRMARILKKETAGRGV